MFKETAKMIYANLGFATIVRNKLRKSSPDVAYDLVKVPTGVEVVRATPLEPVVVAPEVEPEAKPAVAADTVKFVVRMRSMSDKWITLFEPMPNGTVWVYRPHVLAINRLPNSETHKVLRAMRSVLRRASSASPTPWTP
jgi:hypothetical protein